MNNCPIHSIHKAILNVAYKSEASFFMEKNYQIALSAIKCYYMCSLNCFNFIGESCSQPKIAPPLLPPPPF